MEWKRKVRAFRKKVREKVEKVQDVSALRILDFRRKLGIEMLDERIVRSGVTLTAGQALLFNPVLWGDGFDYGIIALNPASTGWIQVDITGVLGTNVVDICSNIVSIDVDNAGVGVTNIVNITTDTTVSDAGNVASVATKGDLDTILADGDVGSVSVIGSIVGLLIITEDFDGGALKTFAVDVSGGGPTDSAALTITDFGGPGHDIDLIITDVSGGGVFVASGGNFGTFGTGGSITSATPGADLIVDVGDGGPEAGDGRHHHHHWPRGRPPPGLDR